jgi:hypothetical protein
VLINRADSEPVNPWGIRFMRMFDMANDSALFRTWSQMHEGSGQLNDDLVWILPDGSRFLPLYEAKMVHVFDHRYGDYAGLAKRPRNAPLPRPAAVRLADPDYKVQPWYWVPEAAIDAKCARANWTRTWFHGWRDTARANDERTLISAIVPKGGVNDKFLLMMHGEPGKRSAALLTNQSSLVLDYIARQKIGGTSFKYY